MSYWSQASATFAAGVAGRSGGLFYARNRTVYSRGSFFELYELPQLSPERIGPTFTIKIYLDPRAPKERCGQGTVATMQADLRKQLPGVEIICEDNPTDILLASCAINESGPTCTGLGEELSNTLPTPTWLGILFGVNLVTAILTWLTTNYFTCCQLGSHLRKRAYGSLSKNGAVDTSGKAFAHESSSPA